MFYVSLKRIEKCATLFFPPQKHSARFIFYFVEGNLEFFVMLFNLKRLHSLRLLSNRCHLLNGYVFSLILAFFSSVMLWECNQNKTLGTVWGVYCPLPSFLCLWKQLCFRTRGDDNTKRAFLVSSSTIARNL